MARPDEERPDDWVDAHRRALEEVRSQRSGFMPNVGPLPSIPPMSPGGGDPTGALSFLPAWAKGVGDFLGGVIQSPAVQTSLKTGKGRVIAKGLEALQGVQENVIDPGVGVLEIGFDPQKLDRFEAKTRGGDPFDVGAGARAARDVRYESGEEARAKREDPSAPLGERLGAAVHGALGLAADVAVPGPEGVAMVKRLAKPATKVAGVAMDAEQAAARTGAITPAQKAVADDLARQARAREIVEATETQGGATILEDGQVGIEGQNLHGYTVGMKEGGIVLDRLTPEDVLAFQDSLKPGERMGTWHNLEDGKYYLDRVRNFSDEQEAHAFGFPQEQQAIRAHDTKQDIPVLSPPVARVQQVVDDPRDVSPGSARRDATDRIIQMGRASSTPEAVSFQEAKAVPGFKRTAAQKIAYDRATAPGQGGGKAYLGSQDEYFSPQTQQVMRGAKERMRPELEDVTGPITQEQTMLAARMSGRTPEAALATMAKRGQGAQAIAEAAIGVEHYVSIADNLASKLAAGGQATLAERLDALFAMRQAAATIKNFNEASSELGRALNARKIAMRRELILDPSDRAFREALKKIGGVKMSPDKVDALLKRLLLTRETSGERGVYALLRDLNKGGLEDQLFEYSQAAILSSPPTHAINVFSGMIQHSLMLARVVGETGIQVGLRPFKKSAAGAEDIAAFGAGYLDGLRNVSQKTYDLMRRRMDFYEYSQGVFAAKHGGESLRQGGAIPGRLGEFVRTPFKVLTIEDFFQTMPAFNARLRQLSSLEAGSEGLKGMDRLARAAEIAKNAPDKMLAEANTFAERYALHARGDTLHAVDAALDALHMRWLVRFTTTPTNLVAMGLDHTPFGLARLRTSAIARDNSAILAEAAIGSSIIGGFAAMMESGQMTGLRPVNKTDRDLMEAEGVGPMMIRSDKVPLVGGVQNAFNANGDVDKRWVGVYALGPLVVPYLLAGAMREVESQRDNFDQKAAQAAVGAMVRTFADQVPMLQGIGDIQNIIENPVGGTVDLSAQVARTFVPSLLGFFERLVDDYRRKPDGIGQTIQAMIPFLAANGIDVGPLHVTPVTGVPDALGRAVENPNSGGAAFFPRGAKERDPHPALIENARLEQFGFPGFTGITKTTPTLGSGTNAVTLSPDGAARYQEIAGQLTERLIMELVNSPGYAHSSDEQKAKDFQTKVNYAKLEARRRLTEEYLGIVTDDEGLRAVVSRVAPDKALGVSIGMRSYTKLYERVDFVASLLPQIEADPALRDAVEAEMTNKPRGPLQSGTVSKVTDGDTLVIGDKSYRLYGVDVPEIGTFEGRAAQKALFEYLTGKTVTFQVDKQDSFGRGLAEVYANGKSVTDWLIDQGLGQARLPPQSDPNRYSLETYRRVIPLREQVKSDPILSAEYVKNGQPVGDEKVWAQVDAERRAWDTFRAGGATIYEADTKYSLYAAYRKLDSQKGGKNPVRKKFVEEAEARGIPLSKFIADIENAENHP